MSPLIKKGETLTNHWGPNADHAKGAVWPVLSDADGAMGLVLAEGL